MASACVNNMGIPSENFMDCSPVKCPSYGWMSPRISFSRDFPEEEAAKAASTKATGKSQPESDNADAAKLEDSDPEASGKEFVDFNFRLEDPVTMLPADELFSDGKLVPLHFRQLMTSDPAVSVKPADAPKFPPRNEIQTTDPYLFSPRAPTCTGRWKELLGLKKLYQNSNAKQGNPETPSSTASNNCNRTSSRGLKHFLHRSSKSALNASVDSSTLNLPLLKEPDNELLSISSRLSLSSSSSSGHEYDDLPRLSLDSDKTGTAPRNSHHQTTRNLAKARVAKHRAAADKPTASTGVGRSPMRRTQESAAPPPVHDVSMDSPRMNSSGKIVFQNLERSSSSPSTFNGGPRYKYRGMERSYSANVRVTPVLNVPVCSLRGSSKSGVFGFPLFSSQQKKDSGSTSISANRSHHHHSKTRIDRA